VKKKIIYANPSRETKEIRITSMNPSNLKVKNDRVEIKPYSNG
jgi:hypothetical protein